MAPASSYPREMAVASLKRPSPDPSDSASMLSGDESASDFGAPNETPKKPVKKKARTTKMSTPLPKDDVVSKIPKVFQSEEGHPLFSAKWWKEIVKCDEFWSALTKHTPKSALQKRLKVEIMIDLNGEDKKEASSGKKAVTTSAARSNKGASGRKTNTPRNEDVTMVDTDPHVGILVQDTASSSATMAADQNAKTISQRSTSDNTQAELEKVTAEASKEPRDMEADDDLLSKAIADPATSPKERAKYAAIQEEQNRIVQEIEADNERKRLEEEERQKRLAKKEEKAKKEADTVVDATGDAEEETGATTKEVEKDVTELVVSSEPTIDEVIEDTAEPKQCETKDKEEKPVKLFAPTNF